MQADVHLTGTQVAEAALLFRLALGIVVGDPSGDTQATTGGTGAPGTCIGNAVSVPWLYCPGGSCGWGPDLD